MPTTGPAQSDAEWVASLTAEQVMDVTAQAMRAGDMEGATAALQILAVKDPAAAARCLDLLQARAALADGEESG